MDFLYIFLLTSFISFAGSIHLGPVNLMVIEQSMNRNLKSAIWVGIGGSLPELFYAWVALAGLSFLKGHPELLRTLNYIVVPVFFVLGCYFIGKRKTLKKEMEKRGSQSFVKGVLLAFLNPQLLPFWLGTLIYLNSLVLINNTTIKIAFVFGTAFGAFIILMLYAFLAYWKSQSINKYLSRFNFDRIIGWSFWCLAGIKMVQFLF